MKTTKFLRNLGYIKIGFFVSMIGGFMACTAPRVLVSEEKIHDGTWKLREQILSAGMQLLGKPYHKAGKGPSGFDCSGLVHFLFTEAGIPMGPSSRHQCIAGSEITLADAQPGDLIFFGKNKQVHHVGLITANRDDAVYVLHSTSSKGVLNENILKSDYWVRRMIRINRFDSYLSTPTP